jgi:hypothetical protein
VLSVTPKLERSYLIGAGTARLRAAIALLRDAAGDFESAEEMAVSRMLVAAIQAASKACGVAVSLPAERRRKARR